MARPDGHSLHRPTKRRDGKHCRSCLQYIPMVNASSTRLRNPVSYILAEGQFSKSNFSKMISMKIPCAHLKIKSKVSRTLDSLELLQTFFHKPFSQMGSVDEQLGFRFSALLAKGCCRCFDSLLSHSSNLFLKMSCWTVCMSSPNLG